MVRSGVSFAAFRTLTTDDVINAVRRLPDKSSTADPLPTTVLKHVIDLLSPFITEVLSRLLATGRFPAGFHQAFITLMAKKPGLDTTDASSYRPMSNLSVLSKLLQRLVACQLMSSADLPPALAHGNLSVDQVTQQTLLCWLAIVVTACVQKKSILPVTDVRYLINCINFEFW